MKLLEQDLIALLKCIKLGDEVNVMITDGVKSGSPVFIAAEDSNVLMIRVLARHG